MSTCRRGLARTTCGIALGLLTVCAGPLLAQPPPDPAAPAPAFVPQQKVLQGVDQEAVNKAIEKGARYLLAQAQAGVPLPNYNAGHMKGWDYVDELALYTLLHADVKRDHPEVVKLLATVTGRNCEKTYVTAIRAQALQKFEAMTLLGGHIQNCAQFLIDNQSQNGYWGYGKPVPLPQLSQITVTPSPSKIYTGIRSEVRDAPASIFGGSPAAGGISAAGGTGRSGSNTTVRGSGRPRMVLKRNQWGSEHDNSNTQYAWLGLLACMAAGFYPPQADCLDIGEKWLTECQGGDGGWNYKKGNSYGSMSAGGVSSLCIVLRAKGNETPSKDPRVERGLQWLGANLNFTCNPNYNTWHYYWIYSVERAGSTAGVEFFGQRQWYPEGATYLLSCQNGDGSWGGQSGGKKIADTCWAILFLRRATKGMVNKITYTGKGHSGESHPLPPVKH